MATVPHPAMARRRISLRGIVQGVGFRPFVFNLAQRIGIRGFVLNSSSGLVIEAEGPGSSVAEFVEALRAHA
ncbi:MAG: acylphosphatase, partial [Acidobacteriaceae bacterium]|nr:acylphosphatase [Acidobacteriaceae bacterium]